MVINTETCITAARPNATPLVQQNISFSVLPLEIREIIYHYSACDPGLHLLLIDEPKRRCAGEGLQHNLQLTCRFIYYEVQYFLGHWYTLDLEPCWTDDEFKRLERPRHYWSYSYCWDDFNYRSLPGKRPNTQGRLLSSQTFHNIPPTLRLQRELILQKSLSCVEKLRIKFDPKRNFIHLTGPACSVEPFMSWFPSLRFMFIDLLLGFVDVYAAPRQRKHFFQMLPTHVALDMDIYLLTLIPHPIRNVALQSTSIFSGLTKPSDSTFIGYYEFDSRRRDILLCRDAETTQTINVLSKRNPEATFFKRRDGIRDLHQW